jgi:hypothetical protein
LVDWVWRRIVNEASRDASARYVHVSLRDNAANLPSDYMAAMEATPLTRPYWHRSFVLGEWGAFEGAAFTEFEDAIHVVAPFALPEAWKRFESMDQVTRSSGSTRPRPDAVLSSARRSPGVGITR